MTHRVRIAFSILLLSVSSCDGQTSACNSFPAGNDWSVSLKSASGARLEGTISRESRLNGLRTSPEGAAESLHYPISDVSLGGNSLRLGFAPARLHIRGTCSGADTVSARYEFHDDTGTGFVIRR